MNFTNHYTFREDYHQGEINNLPSETIPDQSMSVSEIMRRFASGLPISGQRVQLFEDSDLPDIDKLDLVEKAELRQYYATELKQFNEKRSKRQPPKIVEIPPKAGDTA